MTTTTIPAAEVREGDTLPGLSHGYVFEVGNAADEIAWTGHYASAMDGDLVLIGFHDAQGDENYLILRPDHPIDVSRETD